MSAAIMPFTGIMRSITAPAAGAPIGSLGESPRNAPSARPRCRSPKRASGLARSSSSTRIATPTPGQLRGLALTPHRNLHVADVDAARRTDVEIVVPVRAHPQIIGEGRALRIHHLE